MSERVVSVKCDLVSGGGGKCGLVSVKCDLVSGGGGNKCYLVSDGWLLCPHSLSWC